MGKPLHISSDPDLTVIKVRWAGETSWIEFRGPAYHRWWVPGHNMMLHDLLEGWHACILHAGDSFTLLDSHPDYEKVTYFVNMMDRERYPYKALINQRIENNCI